MPAYNFQNRFAEMIERGEKLQTIRKTDKGAKLGDKAYLYTGQRTKKCRPLGMGIIHGVMPVIISINTTKAGFVYFPSFPGEFFETLLSGNRLDEFAKRDGFNDQQEFVQFFKHHYGLPFEGYLHTWKLI